ncbi:uncharacterized protein LOC125056717 [Pieris napi]|uniref:Small multidrug resistance protein n=1 Tax=Pieris macdunnoughi TaxID=345717 RepID=A0A821LW17_9NEOP|nr:uncharacterized protein LOC125056717 [Pieris napi]CAF4756514.1 unnamed protein product [Pieris macdunnoughi]
MLNEAFLSGIWSSAGNALGKLAGTQSIVGDSYVLWATILLTMVMVNTWSLRHYMRSLDAAFTTVVPTVISSASSYVLSGLIGIFLFNEATSLKWWMGAILIIIGLVLITYPRK